MADTADRLDAPPAAAVGSLAPAPMSRADYLALAVLVLGWCGYVALVLLRADGYFDVDGHFHVTVGEKLAEYGWRMPAFPWVTESVWTDAYFDKEWLFHVFLAILLPLGRDLGPKLLIVALNGLLVVGLWACARALWRRMPGWAIAWALLLVAILNAGDYFQRLLMIRPHVLSIAILMVCLGAMLRGRLILLALASLVYAWGYTGHWQLLGLALAADGFRALLEPDGSLRARWWWRLPVLTLVVAGVFLLAALLHPHFPRNLAGLWIQNVQVLQAYWTGTSGSGDAEQLIHAMRPLEIRGLGIGEMLQTYSLLIAGLLACAVHAVWSLRRGTRIPRGLWLFGAYTALYLVMTLLSRRFAEYLVPIGILFVVGYAAWAGAGAYLGQRRLQILAALGTIALLVATVVSTSYNQRPTPRFLQATNWMTANLAPGEVVFTASWSQSPTLFYGAPRQRYLVFLDPMFMLRHDSERFLYWNRTRCGQMEDPIVMLRDYFGARCVFVNAPNAFEKKVTDKFYHQLRQSPHARLVVEGAADGGCVFLIDGPPIPPPADWLAPVGAPATLPAIPEPHAQ